MFNNFLARPLFMTWYRTYSLLFLLALCITLIPFSLEPEHSLHAQPLLLQMAQQHPEDQVSVIVQKAGSGSSAEKLVSDLGGVVTSDLHIINAFGAALPARKIQDLASSSVVRWVSLDTPLVKSGSPINTSTLKSAYIKTIGADRVWNEAPYIQGTGVGVAVLDSGINPNSDFYTLMGQPRIKAAVAFNGGYNQTFYDGYGHGSHVAGIIGGYNPGSSEDGQAYIGVAPNSDLINVKVSDDAGGATASNVVAGLQWINDNRTKYNIRVVNISLNSTVAASRDTDPLCAAAEILWFNGIVVVVSAGNDAGRGVLPPANDPFVITVGATDDKGTASLSDDTMTSYSAFGTTVDGFSKPDLVAPGTNIVSSLASLNDSLALAHPKNIVDAFYFRMSGTSMAAPMVAGTVALMLQANPNLTPDQVKYRLMHTARPFANTQRAGSGYLNTYAAVKGTTTASANTGIATSKVLWSGNTPVTWNSVNWGSVNWGSVNWGSVNWGSVNWGSDYWGQ